MTLITRLMNVVSDKMKPWAENKDEAAVLLLTVSIFLPFYVGVAAVCLAAIVIMMDYQARARALSAPYTGFLLSFLVFPFFISATYNNYWGMLYEMVLIAIVICGFYIRSIMTPQLFDKMMDLSCAASVWAAAIAVYQKATAYAVAPNYRPISVFHNANSYGMIIEFIVIIAIYRMFSNPRFRAAYLAVIGLNLVGLYFSASLSSFAATGCAVFVMLMMKKKYRLAAGLVLSALLFGVAGLIFPAVFPRGILAIDTTCSQRLSIWTTALKGIEQHPLFGTGAMTYQMIYDKFGGYKTYHAHNLLLDTLLNFGFVGLGAIGIYAITQVKLLSLRIKNRIFSEMNILVAAALVAVLVHGLTDVTIFWIQTGMLFLLLFSSMGVGSETLEKDLRLPSLLPEYTEGSASQPVYMKN